MKSFKKLGLGLSLTLGILWMTGCSNDVSNITPTSPSKAPILSELEQLNLNLTNSGIEVLKTDKMTNISNYDISINNYGLVSSDKVLGWINNWNVNKPSHIEGKLFVMQFGQVMPKDNNLNYIKHDDINVFTFDRTAGCTSTDSSRFDGISNMPKPVFSGNEMNQAFAAYNIDPNKDMLLILLGEDDGSNEYLAGVARMWYTMKYWGIESSHISVMNGSAIHEFNPANNPKVSSLNDVFVANESKMPMSGTKTVKDIKRDGTILQASMKDMMNIVEANKATDLILDARSSSEYSGTSNSKTESSTCGSNGTSQCYTGFEGHIKGAKNLEHKSLYNYNDQKVDVNGDGIVDMKDSSFKLKTIPELKTLFTDSGYKDGNDVYTYCRTGTKASLLSFVSSDVLGYKTRMFDGSWIQWGKMANVKDHNNNYLLDENSSYRLDISKYSEAITPRANNIDVNPISKLDTKYTGTSLIILEDKKAKL